MQKEKIRYTFIPTSLGLVAIAKSQKGICFLGLGEREVLEKEIKHFFPQANLEQLDPAFLEKLTYQIENPQKQLSWQLDMRGTAFQQKVWSILLTIPPGQTRTYSWLAQQVGNPRAIRAVARACSQNKIAILIPCHRIIRKNGKISGYKWGSELKRKLILKEKNSYLLNPET